MVKQKKIIRHVLFDSQGDFHPPVAFVNNGDLKKGKYYDLWYREADENVEVKENVK